MPESSLPSPADCHSVLDALHIASHRAGLSTLAMEDATGAKLSYRKLWWRMHLLGGALQPSLRGAAGTPHTAILLPTSVAAAVTFFALHHIGRIPVMLNFSAGVKANQSAIRISGVRHVLTSKAFISKAKLEGLIEGIEEQVEVIYLEDIRGKIGKLAAIGALLQTWPGIPKTWVPKSSPQDAAVVLFTSGSEGTPKGVVLSQRNLLSNIAQAKLHLAFSTADKMFNSLPVFHSFGLTVGTLLPPLLGFGVYFFPSPLQYKQIPLLIKKSKATIFPSTDTFLRGYAAQASADDFASLRMVVAGAERLKPQTATLYREKFGIDILQGYGVTETSPVASANTPEDITEGSVGKLLPGMQANIKPVEGIEEGGELWLKGPNIMLGYMKAKQPGVVESAGEWYNTGDVVRMDERGHLFITGRLKRFAKIGGEMVSLAVVEDIAAEASPDAAHAAVAINDERKGEQIILLTEDTTLSREALIAAGKKLNAAELTIPKKIHVVEGIPRLGNGKVDYIAAGKIAFPAGGGDNGA